ncbi:hypothetical protein [Streptomyces sp. HUAS ZL42]|uniref:hypothetical protein n=1 Tax=Streptomyces sp. HUAS ZL42 TaxID=3231715 RepID=UPI00345F148C
MSGLGDWHGTDRGWLHNVLEGGTAAERRAQLTSAGRTALQGRPMLEMVDGEVDLGLSGGPVLTSTRARRLKDEAAEPLDRIRSSA